MKDSKQIVFEDLTVVIILYKSSNLVLKLIDEINTINILLVDNGGNKNILNIADIAITRAGAGTIHDLIKHNIPSILFPLPHSTNNHQLKNAEYLVDKKCAFIMHENNFDESLGYKILIDLIF